MENTNDRLYDIISQLMTMCTVEESTNRNMYVLLEERDRNKLYTYAPIEGELVWKKGTDYVDWDQIKNYEFRKGLEYDEVHPIYKPHHAILFNKANPTSEEKQYIENNVLIQIVKDIELHMHYVYERIISGGRKIGPGVMFCKSTSEKNTAGFFQSIVDDITEHDENVCGKYVIYCNNVKLIPDKKIQTSCNLQTVM